MEQLMEWKYLIESFNKVNALKWKKTKSSCSIEKNIKWGCSQQKQVPGCQICYTCKAVLLHVPATLSFHSWFPRQVEKILPHRKTAKKVNITASDNQKNINKKQRRNLGFQFDEIGSITWKERAMEGCCTTRYKRQSYAPYIVLTRCYKDHSFQNSIWRRLHPISIRKSAKWCKRAPSPPLLLVIFSPPSLIMSP